MKPLLVFYVTPHGFGHATRAAAVAAVLERRGWRVHFRTRVPAWLFADEGLAAEVTPADVDPGVAMKDALRVDWPTALLEHEAFGTRWEETADAEAGFLRRVGAVVAASDVGALGLDAARRAGIPGAALGNFSWDWIIAPKAAEDPRWEAVRRRMADAYASAALFLHLPLGGDGPAFCAREAVPLVVRRPRLGRTAARSAMGLRADDARPLVAFSFGGVEGRPAARLVDDPLPDTVFAGYEPPPEGFRGEWRRLPNRAPLRHEDLMQAADAVLTKPGYGTFSEALAGRVPVLVVAREDFRESAPIMASLRSLGRARIVERADWEAGRWGAALRGLLAADDPWTELDVSGAEAAAGRLMRLVS